MIFQIKEKEGQMAKKYYFYPPSPAKWGFGRFYKLIAMNPSEEYILNQPEPFRSILLHLQSVIEMTIQDVDLKFRYRIPFYYIDGRPYCYLNQSEDYVDLGFWNAAHLTKNLEHMTTVGRKIMKSLRYRSLEEINDKILVEVLQDAYSVKDKKFYG